MATRLSRPVYVIGVGMHPFNNQRLSSESMADVAGMAALGDAGIAFAEVGALYNGYLGGGVTSGVAIAKEFGLPGIPVTHVENASATGSCAFGEAVHALSVPGGRPGRRHRPQVDDSPDTLPRAAPGSIRCP